MPRRHPVVAVLAMRGIPNRKVARDLRRNAHHLGRVLNGYVPPSPKLRRALAAYLDLPEAALFYDEPGQGAA
jgi:hypothetical protein